MAPPYRSKKLRAAMTAYSLAESAIPITIECDGHHLSIDPLGSPMLRLRFSAGVDCPELARWMAAKALVDRLKGDRLHYREGAA